MKKSDIFSRDILIADDNPGNLKILSVLLNRQGCRVRVALNGESALKSARKYPPNLIMLDIMMPEMNGFEVCKALKSDEKTRDIPVIFISSLDNVADKIRCFELGGVDYITKPFQPQEVSARVKTHLILRTMQMRLEEKNARLREKIIEKKETAKKLRISEQKYRELVENANSIIMRADPDWNIIYINDFAQKFFGYTEKELLYKNVVGTIVPMTETTGRDLAALINNIASHPETFRYNENENICKNRERVWIAWTNKVITDEKGNVAEILCIGNDITEKKRAEKLLNTRLRYEEGLAACSHDLLADIPDALTKAIHHLLRASDASRVYIFENFEDSDDGLCMRQTHEVYAYGIQPEIDNPILQHIPYKDGFERWRDRLSIDKPISGAVASFPVKEKEILEPQGILSILVLPVKVNGNWYGFIGFDDTVNIHDWKYEDIKLLVTASEMIGSYIEREKGREALKELEHIVNQSSVTVFLWRAAEHLPVEFVSDNIRQFGYSPEDFYIRSGLFSNITYSEDSQRVAEEIIRYIRSGHTKFNQEYRIITACGKTRWIERQIWVRSDADGVITHYQGIVTDITDRKMAEDALRESEERFRAIFRNAGIGIALADMTKRFIQVNPAFQKMLKYSGQELLKKTFADITHPDDLEENIKSYSELIEGKREYYQIEKRYIRKDSELIWFNLIVSLIKDASGKPLFTLGLAEDITSRKQMQKELEDARRKSRVRKPCKE